jgi:hypothetical protein
MIDVHPPHGAVHTWKDYLLHMSTIVLGLLIAIGLEQSVEALHHRDQRHQLEEDERAEARRNIDILTTHLNVNIPNMLWYRAAIVQLRTAVAKEGFVDVTLPPQSPEASKPMAAPERYVEPVAIASGSIALLPEPIAQTFARLDFQAQEDQKEVDKIREDTALMQRFALANGIRIEPGEQLHLTLPQRDQLIAVFSTYAEGLYSLLRRDNLFLDTCMAIADGVKDPDALLSYMKQHPLVTNKYGPGR